MSEHRCVFFADADEIATDIPVSLDGSWKSRRMDSRHGFVTAVSADTGEVLDRHYMCSRCPVCLSWADKEGTEEYMEW